MTKHRLYQICEDYKGGMSFEKICKKYGGLRVYIPQVVPDVKERIMRDFNGYNYEILATRYNLSVEKVREIIRRHKIELNQTKVYGEENG
ncbi:Mor transcription activator family protein [Helicobacter sp. 13S00477-4]|uniref:Mor transcription activator family protein n=1 Tax=Helicobacter sp. 13S00477-4 TaxID=1905759 RepID=UPI000BA7118E|nr:Mor transcription activator family protein [Helicobacter sp. 13S00477-4]PAF51299.1 hypothetical protein BKH44_06230 [Helicobacter sp. 13S00477-4]